VGRLQASHTVEIDAPLAEVWEVVADVPSSPVWQPSLQSVEVLETDGEGRAALVEMEADAKVRTTHQRMRFDYSGGPERLSWEQEKGDLKDLFGSWELTELAPGQTRATFALDADPGRVLGMMLRGPVEDKVKDFLTRGAAEGLKGHLEAS
jgi:ribosome-associated toxin RatA of RatAB toxin-antitoxin module